MVVVPRIDLASVSLGGITLSHVPSDLASDKQDALNSDRTLANVGLEVWKRFRVVTDYSRDTVYLLSAESSTSMPFDRDRSGLALERSRQGLTVRAFAPTFPLAGSRWKVGDLITTINGSPTGENRDWKYTSAGTAITVAGIGVNGKRFSRKLVLRDYY